MSDNTCEEQLFLILGRVMAEIEKFRTGRLAARSLHLAKVYAGHHPDNRASARILQKLGFELIENVFYEPTGLMHPSYVRLAPTTGTKHFQIDVGD